MGDHWPEAELIQVFAYLYRNSRLKIPDSWQDTLSNFYLEVSDIVFPSDTQFVSCIGPKSWWWLKIGVLIRSWLMILTENNWGLPMVGMMPSLSLPSQTCGNHSWYVYTVGIWRNLCNNSVKFEQKSYTTRAQKHVKRVQKPSNGRKPRFLLMEVFSLHLDFRTFSDHLELNPLRFGSKSKLVGMASTEPDRLRSCTTLTIWNPDDWWSAWRARYVEAGWANQSCQNAILPWLHKSNCRFFSHYLKDFSPVVSCCRAWGCHGKVAVHANGDGPYVRYGPSGFSWRTVINSTDMHHGFYYTFNWRS